MDAVLPELQIEQKQPTGPDACGLQNLFLRFLKESDLTFLV